MTVYIYIINKFNKCQDLPQNLMLADRFNVLYNFQSHFHCVYVTE